MYKPLPLWRVRKFFRWLLAKMPLPKSWRLFLRRFDIAFHYFREPLRQMWIWLFETDEIMNFLYPITPISRDYMISAVSTITGKSHIEIGYYFQELETDRNLQEHIRLHAQVEDTGLRENPGKLFGRRLVWYAFVRAMKPKVVVEAGIDKGLGSLVLTSALLRNREEGYEGYYYGTDIDPDAGYLLGEGAYAQVGEILYGDTNQTLRGFLTKEIDLFVNDDDHSAEYESKQYELIAQKLSPDAVILGDNAHKTDCLLQFAEATGRQFLFIPEQPARHWYPGAGIGVAFRDASQRCDIFDIQLECTTENYGTITEPWTICTDGLAKDSVIYSIGVGEDISFDLAIVEKFGAIVHTFDPTPRSIIWMNQQSLPKQIHFHEIAVSDVNGTAQFYPPQNPDHISHSLVNSNRGKGDPINVQTKRLSTLMSELGHQHIYVLKMDIEGAEYKVIDDILHSGLDVRQILVEFHHRFSDIGIEKTKNAIILLRRGGYNLFAITGDGLNYSFKKDL